MNRSMTPNSEFVTRRPRVDDIVIHGEVYMRRYHLIRGGVHGWGVRLHHIRKPDDAVLHDHPFDFVSIVLKGSYDEVLRDGSVVKHRWGVPHHRGAQCAHMITRVSKRGTWTLVFRGPIWRRWGFIVNEEWVHHTEYDPEV